MSGCLICTEKEESLRQAVLEHWAAVQKYRAAIEAYENLTAANEAVQATQIRMNEAEDSYRQHLRLMHGARIGAKALVITTFSRMSKQRCQVAGK